MPIREQFWQQHQLWDGTYTISDWLDILEQIPKSKEDKVKFYSLFLRGTNAN